MIRASFATEESVYGVILVAGLIVVSGSHGATAISVFWTVLITVVVFWLAHLYAGTVAGHGIAEGEVVGLGDAFFAAFRHSLGLLFSAAIPCLILLFGATDVINDTVTIWLALWTCVAVLAVLGFIAFTRRHAPWYMRIIGAITTAGFGLVMIVAKAFVH
ncbi:hypothetical protein LK09_13315 [Microbacterium mangrovi]|uniref:Integral membrane protein n=1 Tax=Microbacterium mangrovi TaxID=1348253 RepID=A0A0B2A6R7_9MICO|nr:hypothetical protein LK09_13315 [Microbacterium mangrovi]